MSESPVTESNVARELEQLSRRLPLDRRQCIVNAEHPGTCSCVMRHRAQRTMTCCSRLFRLHENLSKKVNRNLVQ